MRAASPKALISMAVVCLTALAVAACSQEDNQDSPSSEVETTEVLNLHSSMSENGWLTHCRDATSPQDDACRNQPVVWVVTLVEATEPGHLIAQLGPRNSGLRIEADLRQILAPSDSGLLTRTFFLRGRADAELTVGHIPMVRISDAEVLGFQTLVEGPKQGDLAPDMTLAEFGRFCLLAPQETYTEQCAGKRVVWYGLLRGAAPDGVILGLPFEDASIARIKTASELAWPIGNTAELRNTPLVIEGILGEAMARRDNGDPVPIVTQAHIINFSRRTETVAEITGVE